MPFLDLSGFGVGAVLGTTVGTIVGAAAEAAGVCVGAVTAAELAGAAGVCDAFTAAAFTVTLQFNFFVLSFLLPLI